MSGQCTGFSPYDPTIHVMSLYVKPDTSVPQSETAVPSSNNQSEEGVLVNRRLVDLGVANWVEDEPQVLLPEQQQGEAAIPVNSDGKQQVASS